jgi:hypothetical protein
MASGDAFGPPSVSQLGENSTSLQNGITYLLEDESPGEHPSYARAQLAEVAIGNP